MRIGIIGSVKSTEITIECLHAHNFEIVGVLGYEPDNTEIVSGLRDLSNIAKAFNIPYKGYKKINDTDNIKWMAQYKPDVIFAVGFSQLLDDNWLSMPSLGCVGFHPTYLPKGRGRAPAAWIILEERVGAATFFLMGKNADDGPIFSQVPFVVNENDDANTLRKKIWLSMTEALNKWLPNLKKGIWNPLPQEESLATWYGKRSPQDGIIDWNDSYENIDLLIKATTHPYPGAYSFHKDRKVIIYKSCIEKNIPIKGVVGRVLLIKDSRYLIQCGKGLLWIYDIVGTDVLKIGDKLGYNVEYEIYNIKNKFLK